MNVILFTWDNQLKDSIIRYFNYFYNLQVTSFSIPRYPANNTDLVKSFYTLCSEIERKISPDGNLQNLRDAIFLVDPCYFLNHSFVFEEELNAVEREHLFSSLISMLVLSFPEISFIDVLRFFKESVKVEKVLPEVFDPRGLRDTLKQKISRIDDNLATYQKRDKLCFAIDDEKSYAYLEGYTGYILGYRGGMITEYSLLETFENCTTKKEIYIKKDINEEPKPLVFEDLYLNFVDRPPDKHLSDLKKRHNSYPWIYKTAEKFVVSVKHDKEINATENEDIKDNKIKVIYKPLGGIYNLLDETGKMKTITERLNTIKAENNKFQNRPVSHSAPGRLLAISEILIDRSKRIYNTAISPEDCIHGAILAIEAIELLDYKTPTTALEAIAIRHKLEVKAECMFYGVTHNIKVKERLKYLEKEMEIISQWFNKKIREKVKLNALLSISNEITRIFEEFGQFDEEMQSRNYFRGVKRHWDMLSTKSILKKTGYIVIFPFRWYIEKLIDNLLYISMAVILWPVFITLLIITIGEKTFYLQNFCTNPFWNVLLNSVVAFFNLNYDFQKGNKPTLLFFTFMGIFGLVHFGIFISYLYNKISRK